MRRIHCLTALVLFTFLAPLALARVISYSPYTDRPATPALQHRMNRHFVLVEQAPTSPQPVPIGSPIPPIGVFAPGQLVLYDSQGAEEPRVIFPQDGSSASINVAAVREDERQLPAILIQTNADFGGTNPTRLNVWLLTNDGGATWKKLSLSGDVFSAASYQDFGGPFVRARYSRIRTGTKDFPFVADLTTSGTSATVYAIASDATVKPLTSAMPASQLLGSDLEGRRFLVRNVNTATRSDDVFIVDLNAIVLAPPGPPVATIPSNAADGWITPDGGVYLEQRLNADAALWYYKNGSGTFIAGTTSQPIGPNPLPGTPSSRVFFAIPTADYSGAWIIDRGAGRPTQLMLHTPGGGVTTQWQDVSAPEVEALHPAASGTKVLIQVHRSRQTIDQLLFKDPALAVWHIGDPAPKSYDELFLSETSTKGFVHVDVDKIESGDSFVFDSGVSQAGVPLPGPILSPAPPSGGGSDVVQEWGVVRASLAQKLVLPGVGHTPGAFGSNWATDVTIYNPSDASTRVELRFLPNGFSLAPCFLAAPPSSLCSAVTQLTLAPHELRLIPDIVSSLFGLDNDTGALYVTPAVGSGVNVTSHTYNKASNGTYGFTVNGIDLFSAVGPRFHLTFSGAFEGSNFRTNVMVADASGRSTSVNATAAGPNGSMASDAVSFDTPYGGQMQFNSVGPMLGVSASETGALVLQPSRGETIASVFVVDNRTNDPTFFPPDIPASVMRTIPAIGHLDGANGSKFRSDLYLFNNSSQAKTLTLQAKLWDVPESPTTLPLTLLPHEARLIRDVLLNAFGKVGIARLRFTSQGSATDTSVRVTSRTYTIDRDGGTYGFLMPPLNSFQSAGAGDTLEILGASLDPRFRTNLGLVDLAAFPGARPARARIEIIDDAGKSLDSFEIGIPSAGGMQINDLFHGRALPDSGKPVLIRVSTIEGMIGAYAAFVDNGTNDPSYAAANLAAKQ